MSVELTSPFGDAVIEVSDELVDRYVEAGWVKAGAKKAAATPAKSDDEK